MIVLYVDTGEGYLMIWRGDVAGLATYLKGIPAKYRPYIYELVEGVKFAYFKRI